MSWSALPDRRSAGPEAIGCGRLPPAWSDTRVDYPEEVCLHHLFEAQVERTPDAVAAVFGNRTLDYDELNRRSNRLAHRLRGLGVGPEVLVGVFMERSLEMLVALYGILKAGGAYVPLDPEYPTNRLAFMVRDSWVPVLLTQQHLEPRLPEHDARVLRLDADASQLAAESDANPRGGAVSTNLAYVIYTSGSTGRPKGVMNEHRGICNRLFWMQDAHRIGPDDAVLQKTPLGFDVSVWELFWPLMSGARLVIARPGGHRDPAYLRETIALHGVTTLHFVPSMLQIFLQEPELERCRTLRRVICSGEALPLDLMERFFARLPAELHNLYGPTEAAVDVTHWPCRPGGVDGVVPIGSPIANTTLHILDEDLRPVPPGAPGELHIGGVQVARGYLNRPELTAERFIEDPFSEDPRARLYRTGDLARQLPGGDVEYLGRLDFQVKIRGVRIELGEIEATLLGHPALREAVVTAREEAPGDRRLVAYVVPHPGADAPGVHELRSHLLRRLPEVMAPSAFVILPEMPLTPSGKLDRGALPPPGTSRPELQVAYQAPRTSLERFLVRTWQEVLGIERIGIRDDYFELGGDSIHGALIVRRVQQELGEYVYIVALFEAPTVAALARYLAGHYRGAVERRFGSASLAGADVAAGDAAPARLGAADLAGFRRLIAPDRRLGRAPAGEPRNPRALFVLAPPRSGSTLLRVMLAGHSGLFAPQELELLAFDTLREMRDAFRGRFGFWIEGLLRTLMEIESCDPESARASFDAAAERGTSTREFYRRIQERIGERMLVDKTPSYALHLEVLRRMESDFEEPLYIHLLRHPRAMIDSFEATKLDQVFFRYEHPYGVRQLAELIWWESQCNIETLLADVPAERKLALRFEDLVARPRHGMQRVCRFAGLEFEEAMLHPYRDPQTRMTDGLHGLSIMRGDPKFHRYSAIDPDVADRWRRNPAPDCLADGTWEVAERLGYRRRDAVSRVVASAGAGSAAVPVQPRGSRPPFFFVAGVQNHFGDRLGPDQPFYRLQMQNLAAEEPLTATEDMASWCLEGVKAIQPEGPYYLGGHCFGGVVAFEMAQQLRARGEEVALLVLAESYPAASRGELIGSRAWRLWQRLRYQMRQARRAGLRQELGHVGRGLRRRLREWLWRTTETYQDPRAANYKAQRSYVARSYAGRAVLLQCEERTRWRRGLPQNGWGHLLEEGLEVHRVPGSHTGMYREPNVDVLCGILRACLGRAQRDRATI